MTDISHQPLVEIHWYFTKSREQFRLRGNVRVETEEKLVNDAWTRLSENNRKWIADPRVPGCTWTESKEQFDIEKVSKNFRLLVQEPTFVDYVNLKSGERYFWKLDGDNNWCEERVNGYFLVNFSEDCISFALCSKF